MQTFLLFPFLLGALVIFQPSLNRILLDQKGLSYAVLLNGCVVFSMAAIFIGAILFWSDRFPDYLRPKLGGDFRGWYFLPGLMGFTLVLLVPLSIRAVGAMSTVIAMLLGQLATSIVWDYFTDGRPIHSLRILGLAFAALGAYLSFRPAP